MNDTPHLSSNEELLKKIEELNLEKQQLISLVSHDLRSPLNRAFALAELLLMDGSSLTDFQKDYLQKIHIVVVDGLAMMRNLVDYRNLEFRNVDVRPETFNLGEFIHSIVRNFQSIADKKNIRLNVESVGDLKINADKQSLDRVIGNLISNTVKFSKSDKKVCIRVLKHSDDQLKVEIQDEIGGFSKEEFNNLFKKFQKFKTLPTGNESSTGLGLYVAKSMAERVGGSISCKTEEGTGSTFTIILPLSMPQSNK